MPWPTKPACRGSWPEPPPEISATLPGLSVRAAHELVLVAERDDVGMGGGEAVEAFGQHRFDVVDELLHGASPSCGPYSSKLRNLAHEIGDQRCAASHCGLVVAEVRKIDDMSSERVRVVHERRPVGWARRIGFEESAPLVGREVANLEDRCRGAGRDRRGIGGIGDLRDEAAVLAERGGKALARAGGRVEHALQNALVCGDRSGGASSGSRSRPRSSSSTPDTARSPP